MLIKETMAAPGPAVPNYPLGDSYTGNQLNAIRYSLGVDGGNKGNKVSVLGTKLNDILGSGDEESGLGTYMHIGSHFKDGPHGIKKAFANFGLITMWYLFGFFLCDLVYHDFNIVKSLFHLPDAIFGPIRYGWQDVLGQDPIVVILFDKLHALPKPLQGALVWACQNISGLQESGYCPNCVYVDDPGQPTSYWDYAECTLECGFVDIGFDACVDNCLANKSGAHSGWVCDTDNEVN